MKAHINTQTYYVINLHAGEAFEASWFWSKIYLSEAGMADNGAFQDPVGIYPLKDKHILVVPTFFERGENFAEAVNFHDLTRMLEVFN